MLIGLSVLLKTFWIDCEIIKNLYTARFAVLAHAIYHTIFSPFLSRCNARYWKMHNAQRLSSSEVPLVISQYFTRLYDFDFAREPSRESLE